MPPPLPPLASLRAFEAAARHMKFTLAAEELAVTPSAISHQVRGLEDELEIALFRRTGRNFALTDAGRDLQIAVTGAFERMAGAVSELRQSNESAPLTVSLRPYFALKWLSPRLGRFWQRHPGIELQLHHRNQRANFDSQDIDLAIEWRPEADVNESATRLVDGDLTPVCGPALAAAPNPLREPADLAGHVLLHEKNDDRWADWLALAGVSGLEPRQSLVIDDTNVRTQAAMDGQGIELGCPALIQDDIAAGRLVQPFDVRLELFGYYLVGPARSPERPAARAFRNWLIDEAAADCKAELSGQPPG